MNYHGYKFSEHENGYYFYFLSPFDGSDLDLVLETVEHYIVCQYLNSIDFDTVNVEKVIGGSAMDIINNTFPHDDKCMNVSDSFKSLIPPPKAKRQPKKKAETTDKPAKKAPKKPATVTIQGGPIAVNAEN